MRIAYSRRRDCPGLNAVIRAIVRKGVEHLRPRVRRLSRRLARPASGSRGCGRSRSGCRRAGRAEHDPRVSYRSGLELGRQRRADPTEPRVAVLVAVLIGWISRSSPLAKASSAPSATTMIEKSLPRSMAAQDPGRDLLDRRRRPRDERSPSAPPAAPRSGDPAGVAAHHLDDHDPVVGLGGGVQAVDRLGHDLHRGVEAEGEVGDPPSVVVDRLRHADQRRPFGGSWRVISIVCSPPIATMRVEPMARARARRLPPRPSRAASKLEVLEDRAAEGGCRKRSHVQGHVSALQRGGTPTAFDRDPRHPLRPARDRRRQAGEWGGSTALARDRYPAGRAERAAGN